MAVAQKVPKISAATAEYNVRMAMGMPEKPKPERTSPTPAYMLPSKKRSEEVNAVLMATGISPLEMIMNTARDLWAQSNEGPQINMAKRMQACALAEKAMPFLHPRLTSVSVDTNVKRNVQDFASDELAILANADGEDGRED